ncbi:hypothetical protein [Pantoea phage Nufs112]|nr:hypothetical protein [Pantoea phage Nufs112]
MQKLRHRAYRCLLGCCCKLTEAICKGSWKDPRERCCRCCISLTIEAVVHLPMADHQLTSTYWEAYMSITRGLRRVCNYVTWYNSTAEAIECVAWHKKLTGSQRKQWLRLPARKRKLLVVRYTQVASNRSYPQWSK